MKWNKKQFHIADGILYSAAFLLPAVILLFILYAQGFYPFGDKSLFLMDMRDQYLEFFASLRYLPGGDDSLFFSWSRSMGGNYLGLFAYYVASPLSWITAFFSLDKLPSAIVLLTVLKVGLCGLTFMVFANDIMSQGQGKAGGGVSQGKAALDGAAVRKGAFDIAELKKFLLLPVAVCYALASYNMVYSMCLMWLDGVILLPLVLLAVERVLRGKGQLLYILTLTCLFLCNYYTGYMIAIFTALYGIFRILCQIKSENWKAYAKAFGELAIGAILALGLSAPLMLPVVKDLSQGKLMQDAYVPDIATNFSFPDLLGKLANGCYDSITNAGLPSIYCGCLVLVLAFSFLILPKTSWKEKVGAVIIIAILCISFYSTKLDMAWHGFQYPNWFPYRYAFVFSFFLCYLAVRTICQVTSQLQEDGQTERLNALRRIFVVLFSVIGISAAGIDLYHNADGIFEGLNNEFPYYSVTEYKNMLSKTEPLIDTISEQDGGFYRINQNYEFSKNDAMLFGYHGMTHYSSTFHAGINHVTPRLGLAQTHIWNSGYGSNPLLDSLFSVKYILDDTKVPDSYEKLSDTPLQSSAYRNHTALPIAYSVPAITQQPVMETADVYQNQNQFLNGIASTQTEYYTNCTYEQTQNGTEYDYTLTAPSSNPLYLYMLSDGTASYSNVYVNEEWVGAYFSSETNCSLYLGSFQAGETVSVRVVPTDALSLAYVAIGELHMEELNQTLEKLASHGMEITGHKNGTLSGKITAEEGSCIMTSIPYDEGWSVKIDGKKVETGIYAGAFLTAETPAGTHEITFHYISPGFLPSLAVFAVSLVLVLLYATPLKNRFGFVVRH